MATISMPKTEYNKLKRQAKARRNFSVQVFEKALTATSIKELVEDFRKTGLYNKEFLKDLETGLRRSSLAKRYAHKTSSSRS